MELMVKIKSDVLLEQLELVFLLEALGVIRDLFVLG